MEDFIKINITASYNDYSMILDLYDSCIEKSILIDDKSKTEKDNEFIDKLQKLIIEYYGN